MDLIFLAVVAAVILYAGYWILSSAWSLFWGTLSGLLSHILWPIWAVIGWIHGLLWGHFVMDRAPPWVDIDNTIVDDIEDQVSWFSWDIVNLDLIYLFVIGAIVWTCQEVIVIAFPMHCKWMSTKKN